MTETNWKEKVKEVLDQVRPALQRDGGDVELIDINDEGIVTVRLQGACAGCPMSQMTLKMGIEQHIKRQVPEVKEVRNLK
ncbi:MAG TPA: NifU family protein [bacterium]|nr:NifU family protein [bacterium]HPS30166.1 NifU family protein [bacterium]